MYKIPAVIFAGGKSTRMGKDKALLPFGGYPSLSQYQYQRLSTLFEKVYLGAKEHKFDFTCQVIEDQYTQSSPLVGILSLFDILKVDAVFILSVDAPLIDISIIQELIHSYERNKNCDAVIAQSPKGLQPLCGIYTKSILPLVQKHLDTHTYRLQSLLNNAHIKTVVFNDEKPFANLNTPNEYKALFLG